VVQSIFAVSVVQAADAGVEQHDDRPSDDGEHGSAGSSRTLSKLLVVAQIHARDSAYLDELE
jgi:hypothetical protein